MQEQTNEITENTEGQSVFSLHLFNHAQRVAVMLSESALIPKEFVKNVPNVMIALEMANRVGASPLMVMQNLYVVYGKPSWSSKFVIAAINTCGRFAPLRMQMFGEKETRSCIAWTVEKGIQIPVGIQTLDDARQAKIPILEGPEISWAMAKSEGWIDKNGSKWKTMPELMFRYRAASFFGNLYCPEVLMGMRTVEETIDIGYTDDPIVKTMPTANTAYITHEELQQLFSDNTAILGAKTFKNGHRILENKETESYSKLAEDIKKDIESANKEA